MLHPRRMLIPALLIGLLLTACTDLPINEYGDTPTDGQLKVQALADVAEQVAKLDVMRLGLVEGVEDLGSDDDHTLLHDRFEEALITELSRRGYFAGSSPGGGSYGSPASGDDDGGKTEAEMEIEEARREREEIESGNTPSPSPSGNGTAGGSVSGGSLSYRLIECRVVYYKSGSSVQRNAVARAHVRIPSPGGEGYAWVGEIQGGVEDYVKVSAAEELIDTRYPDIGPERPEEEETPILEPIIVTAVTVGLILLFSFTSQ